VFVSGIGFVWQIRFFVSQLLERQELRQAPPVLARQARFVAHEHGKRLAVIRHVLEGDGEEEAVVEVVALRGAGGRFDGAELFVHEHGFDEPEALSTPTGDGHFLD